MPIVTRCLLAGSALAAGLVPTLALAAPKAMLEKSATYALDSTIRSFRVPTQDATGKINYYDVTITLTVDAKGKPTAAVVSSALSPSVVQGVIQPGTYRAANGATCTVTNITLNNGRIQSFFACLNGSNAFQLSVATGGVTAGHPFLPNLVAAGIDKRSDVNTFTWGRMTNGASGAIGTCDSFFGGYIIGAKTNGNLLELSTFHPSTGAFSCSVTFSKQ